VSARPAHRATDAGSGRIVRLTSEDFAPGPEAIPASFLFVAFGAARQQGNGTVAAFGRKPPSEESEIMRRSAETPLRKTALANFPQRGYPQDMNQILRLTILLVVLAWSHLAFCSEIHDAAKAGDLNKVKVLLKADPNLISSKDNFGMTALHYAVAQYQKDMVQLLLANKADVNAKDKPGWTPLHYAAAQGYKDIAKLLLTNKAEIDATNNYGFTPLHLAADGGFKEVAELLLANKAEVNARNNYSETPLHRAVKYEHKEVVEALLDYKADVNAKDYNGFTPLHVAAVKDYKDIAELLMAKKANVNALDNNSQTPLSWAHDKDMTDLLHQHGGTNGLKSADE
jgi:ankyrin repeat protein